MCAPRHRAAAARARTIARGRWNDVCSCVRCSPAGAKCGKGLTFDQPLGPRPRLFCEPAGGGPAPLGRGCADARPYGFWGDHLRCILCRAPRHRSRLLWVPSRSPPTPRELASGHGTFVAGRLSGFGSCTTAHARHLERRPCRSDPTRPVRLAPLIFVGLSRPTHGHPLVPGGGDRRPVNSEHPLMQRYGITLLTGSRARRSRNLETPFWCGFVCSRWWVTAASVLTPPWSRAGMGSTNAPAVHLLTTLRPRLHVLLFLSSLVCLGARVQCVSADGPS